jgi:DNA-binding GntR family transcriptional regulator
METSKKSEAYAAIKRAIIAGELAPGTIINEWALAERFGVSRTPVREALSMLGFEGLVENLPRAGYRITEMTVRDVQEGFHLREILECEGARLAAQHISAADLDKMDERTLGYLSNLDAAYNREFHLTIARASRNQRLARLVGQLLDEMERMLVYDPLIANPQSTEEHERITIALRARDPVAAAAAMREHLRAVKSRVLERF